MKLPKIEWAQSPLFKKTPLILVVVVTAGIAANVYLNLKINSTQAKIAQIKKDAIAPPRKAAAKFAKIIELGEKKCPYQKAGNPAAPLKFKLFESETCPFCIAQNKVMDELLPQYGDLIYAEWYQVVDCPKDSEKYKITGVPTFIFTAKGIEKPSAYGFLDKGQLIDYICRVSGQC